MANFPSNLQSLRDRIAAIDCYTAQGARDAGLHFADISTEHVRAFQDHVLDMIDEALQVPAQSPTAGAAFDEVVRAYGLSRETVIAWATGLPPSAIETPAPPADVNAAAWASDDRHAFLQGAEFERSRSETTCSDSAPSAAGHLAAEPSSTKEGSEPATVGAETEGKPLTLGRLILDTARGDVKARTLSPGEARSITDRLQERIEEMRGALYTYSADYGEAIGGPLLDGVQDAIDELSAETTVKVVDWKASYELALGHRNRLAQYILVNLGGAQRIRDHACPQCMPEGGDLVNADFTCSYHLAMRFIGAVKATCSDPGYDANGSPV